MYLDETGDHSLEPVDPDFPVFVLVLLICDVQKYREQIVPAFYRLKFDYFGHEGVILHSRDIRKAQGDFAFLANPEEREGFYERLNEIMGGSEYTLIAVAIRKQKHKEKYGKAAKNPYDLAFAFALERLLPLLESLGQTEVQLIAEARGKREDAELKLAFLEVVNQGTYYIGAGRFKKIKFRLDFRPKEMNIIGHQMADLAAYPIARYVLNPDPKKVGQAFRVVQRKFYRGPGFVHGLKIFP